MHQLHQRAVELEQLSAAQRSAEEARGSAQVAEAAGRRKQIIETVLKRVIVQMRSKVITMVGPISSAHALWRCAASCGLIHGAVLRCAVRQVFTGWTKGFKARKRNRMLLAKAVGRRARPRCRVVPPPTHFIPGSLTYSAPLRLRWQCDRTLGRPLHARAAGVLGRRRRRAAVPAPHQLQLPPPLEGYQPRRGADGVHVFAASCF